MVEGHSGWSFTDPGVVTGGDWTDIGSGMTCGRNRGPLALATWSHPSTLRARALSTPLRHSLLAAARRFLDAVDSVSGWLGVDGIVHWSFLVVELGERKDLWSELCSVVRFRRENVWQSTMKSLTRTLVPNPQGPRGLYSRHKRPESLLQFEGESVCCFDSQ